MAYWQAPICPLEKHGVASEWRQLMLVVDHDALVTSLGFW
jgi:hypothetical protein